MENKIEVYLPKDMAGEIITFTKEGEEKNSVTVDEEGIAKIENLQEGIYLIEVSDTQNYDFADSIVSVPLWSEEEQNMLHEIMVIPKYTRKIYESEVLYEPSPVTGDHSFGGRALCFAVISLIIVVIITCHKRFKCGRMFDKYSRKRRT